MATAQKIKALQDLAELRDRLDVGSPDTLPLDELVWATMEIAYQLAVMNQRNAARDETAVRDILTRSGCADLIKPDPEVK